MKVKILGTGSIYSKHNCASLIIDDEILVDVGPGVVKQLIKGKNDLRKINSILITHLHSDHILDFPAFIVNAEIMKRKNNINIYSPEGTKEKLISLLKLLYGNYFDNFANEYLNFKNISNNDILEINNKYIQVKSVEHEGIETYGFIIDSKIGITGDSSFCDNIVNIYNDSHILICDCSNIKGDKYHMGIDSIKKLINIDDRKKIIPTHYRDITKEKIKEMRLNNVLIVEDGYEFEI